MRRPPRVWRSPKSIQERSKSSDVQPPEKRLNRRSSCLINRDRDDFERLAGRRLLRRSRIGNSRRYRAGARWPRSSSPFLASDRELSISTSIRSSRKAGTSINGRNSMNCERSVGAAAEVRRPRPRPSRAGLRAQPHRSRPRRGAGRFPRSSVPRNHAGRSFRDSAAAGIRAPTPALCAVPATLLALAFGPIDRYLRGHAECVAPRHDGISGPDVCRGVGASRRARCRCRRRNDHDWRQRHADVRQM